jgi:hypothetical protein
MSEFHGICPFIKQVLEHTVNPQYSTTTTFPPLQYIFQFTATLDIRPQIVVNKQWHYIGVSLYIL